jgi:diguanylate cyclase (GGDEF)-like protein/PAS domain S-box-containing protein
MDTREAFVPAELPSNEIERLIVLARYSILDTPREPTFDSLTAVGAFSFQVPLCLITLIGKDFHFFKSAYGTEVCLTPREGSFSDYALLQDEPLVVLDAIRDPRFVNGPHVKGDAHIRFYAGAPLVSADGYKLGTFCILDRVARQAFGQREIETLKHLASLTAEAMEQRLLTPRIERAERDLKDAAEQTKLILESTTDDVFLLDKEWNFTYINEKANSHMARGRNLLGRNFWEAFPYLRDTQFERNYRKVVEEQVPIVFEDYSAHLRAFLEIHAQPCGDGLAVFFRDITPQRVQELALRKAEERYRIAALTTSEGIWDWDWETGETYFSARCQEIIGLPAVDVTAPNSLWTERFHPKDRLLITQDLGDQSTDDSREFRREYRILHEDGSWRWIRSRGTVFRNKDGEITRMLGAISDITDRKTMDPLSGLNNRTSLLEKIEQRIESEKESESSTTFALLVLRVDQFKRIHDSFGQPFGDAVLVEIARRLETTLDQDAGNIAARVGEEEFAVMMNRVHCVEDTISFANDLQEVLSVPIGSPSQPIPVSVSFGIAMGDEGYTNPQRMLEDAIVALNQAKSDGRARCTVFGIQMRERTRRKVQLELDLRGAVEGEQLRLYYQPKVLLSSGELIGFEALVRWIHPVRGLISPDEFIAFAEESGLILEIGRWTLREAIRQLMEWRRAGVITDAVTMAVNLSPRQFEQENLASEIRRLLEEESLPPAYLTLELTESALVGNIVHAKESLTALNEAGIRIDMDDFGTGYSSLSHLHTLPFHGLKIDKSFTQNLEESKESQAIARSIIQLGQSLNMGVIAEGIETEEQRNWLLSFGCLFGQGFFYSRPLQGDVVEEILRSVSKSKMTSVYLPLPQPSLNQVQ